MGKHHETGEGAEQIAEPQKQQRPRESKRSTFCELRLRLPVVVNECRTQDAHEEDDWGERQENDGNAHAVERRIEDLCAEYGTKAIGGGGETHRLSLTPRHGSGGDTERQGVCSAVGKAIHQPEAKQQTRCTGGAAGNDETECREHTTAGQALLRTEHGFDVTIEVYACSKSGDGNRVTHARNGA